MVRLFGLKIGGDKKKKAQEQAAKPHEWKRIDQNLLGEGQFFGLEPRGGPNGSIRSGTQPFARPGTSHSTRIGTSPYTHDTNNIAASSMFNLSQQGRGVPNLKSTQSDANLRFNFGNDSSTSLQLPRPIGGSRPGTPTRPGTSDGTERSKAWVNPLDVHFSRPIPTGPKSPLGQSDSQADEGNDNDSLFGDKPENIAQEIINRVNTAELKALPSPTGTIFHRPAIPSPLQSPTFPSPAAALPSPPQSVISNEKPTFATRDARANVLAGSPSPPLSSPRESHNGEDEHAESEEGRPVVQNVKAKRDTLMVDPNRRQSLSMKIEEFEKSLVKEQREAQQNMGFDFGLDKEEPAPEPKQITQHQEPPRQQRDGGRSPPFATSNSGPRPESPAGYMPPPRGFQNGPRPSSPGPRRGPGPGMGGPMGQEGPMGGQRGPPMRSPVDRPAGGAPMGAPMGTPMGAPMGSPMRGPMGGPRGPGPNQPWGMPMNGRRPQSPAGMRGPRPESPMGRVPRPHSPAGMRGPRPESPMGRVPRPHSPAGMRGPPGQSPMGGGPRAESPMGRSRRASPPRRLRLEESPMGRQHFDGPPPRSPMGPPAPRTRSPGPGGPRGRQALSPTIRSPRDESPVDPWPMSDPRKQQEQQQLQPRPNPQPPKSAMKQPSQAKPQPAAPSSHMPLDSPTFGAFGVNRTVMMPPRQGSPAQHGDPRDMSPAPRANNPRGFPSNRPPRPSLEEYGVPVARRAGTPAAAVGARSNSPAVPSPVQSSFPANARLVGHAPVPSPLQSSFPPNARTPQPDPVKPSDPPPVSQTAPLSKPSQVPSPMRFALDDDSDDEQSFFPIQRPSNPPKSAPAPPAKPPTPTESQPRPNAFSRPRPPPLFDLGLDGPGGLPTPASSAPAASDWPLPSPSAVPPPRSARAPPPAPLNLAVTASEYMDEIGGGPWTPPKADEDRGRSKDVVTPENGKPDGHIGVARGLSVKVGSNERDASTRRPDYGLKSPTGIADKFGTGFI